MDLKIYKYKTLNNQLREYKTTNQFFCKSINIIILSSNNQNIRTGENKSIVPCIFSQDVNRGHLMV